MDLSTLDSNEYQKHEIVELMRTLSVKRFAPPGAAVDYYRQRWGRSPLSLITQDVLTKAAIAPGTSTDASWAGPLTTGTLSAGFLALIRRESVIGQLAVTKVPFGVPLVTQVSGASMLWVGEGAPKPSTKVGLGELTLGAKKASAIIAVTKELLQLGAPGSEEALKTILAREITAFIDASFLSTTAATAAQPAGILAGVTPSTDLAGVLTAFFASRPQALKPTWIMSPATVATQQPGQDSIPGTFRGYPMVLTPAAGANLILVDAAAIAVADRGVELDVSEHAMIELVDTPAAPTAATVQTSFFQNNLIGIRVERFINWHVDPSAVSFMVQA